MRSRLAIIRDDTAPDADGVIAHPMRRYQARWAGPHDGWCIVDTMYCRCLSRQEVEHLSDADLMQEFGRA